MKKWLVYLLGMVTGIVLTICTVVITIHIKNDDTSIPGLTFSSIALDYNATVSEITIEEIVFPGGALAEIGKKGHEDYVIFMPETKAPLYDGLKFRMPKDKCFKCVGTYAYDMGYGKTHTLPVVKLFDKQ